MLASWWIAASEARVYYFSCHSGIGALRGLRVEPCVLACAYLPPGASRRRGLPPRRELGRSWLPRWHGARGAPGRRNPMPRVVDTRITGYEPLLSPAALLDELPLGGAESALVERTRTEVRAVLEGTDSRVLVITGPCSVHDPKAARDYARRLVELRDRYA